eukprot:scaffold7340_cov266-Pinguiococcus_pyrenoidosus.AAC.17
MLRSGEHAPIQPPHLLLLVAKVFLRSICRRLHIGKARRRVQIVGPGDHAPPEQRRHGQRQQLARHVELLEQAVVDGQGFLEARLQPLANEGPQQLLQVLVHEGLEGAGGLHAVEESLEGKLQVRRRDPAAATPDHDGHAQ